MYVNRTVASLLALLVVATSVAPAVATTRQEAYASTHVSFDVTDDAVVDYAVGGETMFESMKVQSKSEVEGSAGIGIGAGLSAASNFTGAALSLGTRAETSATVTADSGATIRAHDNPRGSFVVVADGESQYVAVNVSDAAQVESESENRVVVTNENGTEGTFIVVGNGNVTVNDGGNVTAELDEDARLVFRAYSDGREDADRTQERLIANGTAAAEVYVMGQAEGGAGTTADVVNYSGDTAVEVTRKSEGTVSMTVDRSGSEGKVVITSVSEAVIESAEGLRVTVDGEAAAEASSYSELQGAIGGDRSKYLVRQGSSAEAGAEVLVAVNHFSERTVTMESEDAGGATETGTSGTPTESNGGETATDDPTDGEATTTEPSDGGGTDTPGQPGFGVTVAVIAVLAAALLAVRRRR